MNTDKIGPTPIYVATVLLSIAIFLVDLGFTQGVAAGVPYIAVVLLSRWSGEQRAVFTAAAGVTVLTIVGFFIPFPDRPMILIGIENRVIADEPFFTTKSVGTGLGMPICKRIVEAHGGDLHVGKRKVGAELVVSLPLNENAEPSSAATSVSGASSIG